MQKEDSGKIQMSSEFSSSALDEILKQLEELKNHSGKDANEIFPKTDKYITPKKKAKKTVDKVRERLNATVLHTEKS